MSQEVHLLGCSAQAVICEHVKRALAQQIMWAHVLEIRNR